MKCPLCEGKPWYINEFCPRCNGSGKIPMINFNFSKFDWAMLISFIFCMMLIIALMVLFPDFVERAIIN